jgi:hypothetical protein
MPLYMDNPYRPCYSSSSPHLQARLEGLAVRMLAADTFVPIEAVAVGDAAEGRLHSISAHDLLSLLAQVRKAPSWPLVPPYSLHGAY